MKYNGNINYVKCFEFGLNLSQGAVMDLLGHLATWADGKEIDGEVFYHLSAQKMTEELPIISENKNTFLKIIKTLKEKGLISHIVYNNKGYYKLTDEGKSFTRETCDEQKECGKKSTPQTKCGKISIPNEGECGKKSTLGVEKIPHNNNTNNNIYNTSSLRSEVLCDEHSFEENSEDSTKAKFGQNLEAEKLVRKTSRVSNQEENEKRAKLKEMLTKAIGCDEFKDLNVWTELGRLLRLGEKIGRDVFLFRLYAILEDEFKAKNCNKLSYLRKEISAFIHSPMVPTKSQNSPGFYDLTDL